MPPHQSSRKPTPPASTEGVVTIVVDGERYPLDIMGLNHNARLDLWRAVKLTIPQIFEAFDEGAVDPVFVAALVFLSVRQSGGRETFDEIAERVTFTSDVDMVIGDGVDEPGPKAPDAP